MTLAISAHGTIIARALAATPTVFTDIAELEDITLPELMRNVFDATTQDKDIDNVVLGVLRRGEIGIAMNLLPTNATHDHLTGLQQAIISNTVDGYRFTMPQSLVWTLSGQINKITMKAPVDGKLSMNVAIRASGKMLINGIVIG